jgi:hypothetical protein
VRDVIIVTLAYFWSTCDQQGITQSKQHSLRCAACLKPSHCEEH